MKVIFITVVAVAVLTPPIRLPAQSVVFDSAIERYRVSYHSGHLGRTVVLMVDPPNKIEPSVRLDRLDNADGELTYHYVAANGRGMRSKQSVVEFDFDCPERQFVSVAPPENWEKGVGPSGQGFVCILIEDTQTREAAVAPGEILSGLEVRTPRLPGLGTARFWGDAEQVQWPSGESMEALDPKVIRAVEQLEGIGGGWVERAAIVPIRDRGQAPIDILQALYGDLAEICQAREWISVPLCRSYRAELGEIVTAVRDERYSTAREGIQTFLEEIETARESPERQLDLNAYWLLRANLEAVGADLAEDLSAEDSGGRSNSSVLQRPASGPGATGTRNEVRGFWSRLWLALRNLPPA